ncbi:branched-chain amino acid ABC transporter permease [Orrella daihaiensis]|uniref:Branched-chain amino acid ABC transporter permease n=1 Tax=Orrella daihaiensis TaxID=2782176 RepID=A0ABY4AI89_9BURK|nr:branched-chain amino acid ABC transporter permease [Orrella daihaiensis]UOD50007.1 branched-chain amino acid ABC transporter permease [Orrella daihaiensis]
MARDLRTFVATSILIFLAAVPLYAWLADDVYVLTYFGRILAFALAAIGLNLVLGFGGMASLGHAMYIGLGAYTVGILSSLGLLSGWLHLSVALVTTFIIAIPVGWVALRTRGMAFIMITLAFAQLFFYVFVSLRQFGGDEGLSLTQLSDFGVLTGNKYAVYTSLLVALLITLWLVARLVDSRFGLVLRATRFNARRVNAVGTSSQPYRLAAYVLSAEICAVAGYFMANLNGFVSPAMMSWLVSAELMVMVLLGGMGTIFGPIAGAAGLLLIEDGLKLMTEHWPLVLGPLVLLMVLGLRQGLWGMLLPEREKARQSGGQH